MKVFIKLLISLGLVFLLVRTIDFETLLPVFSDANVKLLSLVACAYVSASVFEILKLYVLVVKRISFLKTIKLVYIGLFFNNLLPTNIGGDSYKIFLLQKGMGLNKSLAIVLFDRVFGITTLLFWFAVYLLFQPHFLTLVHEKISFPNHLNIMVVCVAVLVVSIAVLLIVSNKFKTVFYNKIYKHIAEILSVYRTFSRTKLFVQFALASAYHLSRLFAFTLLVLAFHGSIVWYNIIPVLSLVAIVSILPISFGGLGLREGTIVVALVIVGVDYEVAISVAAVNLFVLWFKSAIGLAIFTTTRHSKLTADS